MIFLENANVAGFCLDNQIIMYIHDLRKQMMASKFLQNIHTVLYTNIHNGLYLQCMKNNSFHAVLLALDVRFFVFLEWFGVCCIRVFYIL